jgi:hypothetical protein
MPKTLHLCARAAGAPTQLVMTTASAAYDTLDDLELGALPKDDALEYLYGKVCGAALAQTDICGTLTTGVWDQTHSAAGGWGSSFRIDHHEEAWQVRSSPRGRIGMRLEENEVRQVVVLVRSAPQTRTGTVSILKLWRMSGKDSLIGRNIGCSLRGVHTRGTIGVAMHALKIFEERETYEERKLRGDPKSDDGIRAVLSSVSMCLLPDGSVQRQEPNMDAHYAVATNYVGGWYPDPITARHCTALHTDVEWRAEMQRQGAAYEDALRVALSKKQQKVAGQDHLQTTTGLAFSARAAFEQVSLVGMLDMLSDPLHSGALPDDMHQPYGFPLIIALAVRIACAPHRVGIERATKDDAYATKEVALLWEAVQPSVIASGSDGVSGDQLYGIDVVINHACVNMLQALQALHADQLGESDSAETSAHDCQDLEEQVRETMRFLFAQGMAVCVDVCGVPPEARHGASELRTPLGYSTWDADPVQRSRTNAARRLGMGDINDCPAHRTTTRGQRQRTLIRTMQSVECWLGTNRYRNMVVRKSFEGRLCDISRRMPPTADAPAAADTPKPPTQGSSKRKKKKGGAADPKAALVNNGKRRVALEQHCINLAVASLAKNRIDLNDDYIALQCERNLNGVAVNEAHGILGDLLQVGGCYGASKLYSVETYAVSKNSWTKCAHCPRHVNVVQSVAFGGALGRCARCGHPRCLHCVFDDIEIEVARATGVDWPEALSEPTATQLDSCLRCYGSK